MGNNHSELSGAGGRKEINGAVIPISTFHKEAFETLWGSGYEAVNELIVMFDGWCKGKQVDLKNHLYINDLTGNPESWESRLASVLGIKTCGFQYETDVINYGLLAVPVNNLQTQGAGLKKCVMSNFSEKQIKDFPVEFDTYPTYGYDKITGTRSNLLIFYHSNPDYYKNDKQDLTTVSTASIVGYFKFLEQICIKQSIILTEKEEEQRRKEEEYQRAKEEQRKKEEEQRRKEEEQRRKEEEQRRKEEEDQRKEEERE
jgi:hypothetical protein